MNYNYQEGLHVYKFNNEEHQLAVKDLNKIWNALEDHRYKPGDRFMCEGKEYQLVQIEP